MKRNILSKDYWSNSNLEVKISIIPNFRIPVVCPIDAKVTASEHFIIQPYDKYMEILIGERAEWVLVEYQAELRWYITKFTMDVPKTPMYNIPWRELLIKAQDKYLTERRNQVRLYFWDSKKGPGNLSLCWNHIFPTFDAVYHLNVRHRTLFRDKRFCNDRDCFFLGTVYHTVYDKYNHLLDFIIPFFDGPVAYVSDLRPASHVQDELMQLLRSCVFVDSTKPNTYRNLDGMAEYITKTFAEKYNLPL